MTARSAQVVEVQVRRQPAPAVGVSGPGRPIRLGEHLNALPGKVSSVSFRARVRGMNVVARLALAQADAFPSYAEPREGQQVALAQACVNG
ncbi:hypothetical protein [Microvirga makkahensis]|uniref:Uncharacterized protein n=1 Tax=Microvirga makkahensis TaxID=1128670 RepID=A0A7X3MSW8_9HYPH|nr:hypothetical protein [Microvirga makkahensis]MXQ12463.1 hypothetical protein [Microvirga makkahensis]